MCKLPNVNDLTSVSSIEVSSEFAYIGSDGDQVMAFDLRMREAICLSIQEFFGLEITLDTAMTKDLWDRYEIPCSLFLYLSLAYANQGLGARQLRQRPLIECLITFVTIEATMGAGALKVLLNEQEAGMRIGEALRGNKIDGEPRLRSGIEMLKLPLRLNERLPASYRDLERVDHSVKRKTLPYLLKSFVAPKKSPQEKESIREAEDDALVTAISVLRKEWGIEGNSTESLPEWLFEKRVSTVD